MKETFGHVSNGFYTGHPSVDANAEPCSWANLTDEDTGHGWEIRCWPPFAQYGEVVAFIDTSRHVLVQREQVPPEVRERLVFLLIRAKVRGETA